MGTSIISFPVPPLTVKQCLRLSELQEKHGILPWYGGSYISRQNKSRPTRLLENSCVTLQKRLVPPGQPVRYCALRPPFWIGLETTALGKSFCFLGESGHFAGCVILNCCVLTHAVVTQLRMLVSLELFFTQFYKNIKFLILELQSSNSPISSLYYGGWNRFPFIKREP